MKDSNLRSLIKGISWRVIGTLDTVLISFILTGTLNTAIFIGSTELVTKLVLFYLHERGWNRIRWGRDGNTPSHLRSLVKGISWRAIGSFDTMIVAYFYTHELLLASKVAGTEVITKIVLFYLHERAWAMIPYGRIWETENENPKPSHPNPPLHKQEEEKAS